MAVVIDVAAGGCSVRRGVFGSWCLARRGKAGWGWPSFGALVRCGGQKCMCANLKEGAKHHQI